MLWRTLEEMLADDARLLREVHGQMVAAGDPPKAAAKYLAGWVGGFLGEVVGFMYATTGAGVLADGTVGWRFHPDGWPDRVDVTGTRVVVPAHHPWSGQPGVQTVDDDRAVRRRVVEALDDALTPHLAAVRTLAKVGRSSLWAEVADGVGSATAASPELAGSVTTIPAVESLLCAPGAPWRARPRLWAVASAVGPLVVAHRGCCCLAYTGLSGEPDPAEEDLDPEHRAYEERFPPVEGEPQYCSTCCLRDPADVEARQVFWAELQAGPVRP
jgi:hypothetical protein